MKDPSKQTHRENQEVTDSDKEADENSVVRRASNDDGYESEEQNVQSTSKNSSTTDLQQEQDDEDILSKLMQGLKNVEITSRAPMMHRQEQSRRLRSQSSPFNYNSNSVVENRYRRSESTLSNVTEDFQNSSTSSMSFEENGYEPNIPTTITENIELFMDESSKLSCDEFYQNLLTDANTQPLPVLDSNFDRVDNNTLVPMQNQFVQFNIPLEEDDNEEELQDSTLNIPEIVCMAERSDVVHQTLSSNQTLSGGYVQILPPDVNDSLADSLGNASDLSCQNLTSVPFRHYRRASSSGASPSSSTSDNSSVCSNSPNYTCHNDPDLLLDQQLALTSLINDESFTFIYKDILREQVNINKEIKRTYWVSMCSKEMNAFITPNRHGLNYIQNVAKHEQTNLETHLYCSIEFVSRYGSTEELRDIFNKPPKILDLLAERKKNLLVEYVKEIIAFKNL